MLEIDSISNTTITVKDATERLEFFLEMPSDHVPTTAEVLASSIIVHRSTLKVLPDGEILAKQFGTSRINRTVGDFIAALPQYPGLLQAIIALADTWAAEDKEAADEALEDG
jgi:hypothetical protein